ncbi:HD domain-containing protein [Paenibacillus sp. GP183]|jgi:putative nucleotidyltransferase with HDIG domain|uniref:HD domain-containing protein n=1 Tax=Paenibacillus sp. GP183 TaxID=1882751 RepID=UPI00089B6F7A|nr:HD domain-containing protein [Paenibacillus sp. GP183]SEC00737.1 HDIG domain-containing protein [Paenibacillus sp. GP183]
MQGNILRELIIKALPELQLIQNEHYKKAVISIWEEAYSASGWENLEDVPKSGDVVEYSNLQHSRSVTLQAIACADVIQSIHQINVDRDILITSALLHDIGKCFEYTKEGMKTRYGKLMQHGFYPVQKAIEHDLPLEIQHLIVTHTGLSKIMPQTVEALILHYVDYLDSDVLLHVLNKPLFLKK